MDHAVALVEAYLRVNGFFTVSEIRLWKLGTTAGCGPLPMDWSRQSMKTNTVTLGSQ